MTCTSGCNYSFMYSWWWVWTAPETSRVILQKIKYRLHIVASRWIFIIQNCDPRNHEHKICQHHNTFVTRLAFIWLVLHSHSWGTCIRVLFCSLHFRGLTFLDGKWNMIRSFRHIFMKRIVVAVFQMHTVMSLVLPPPLHNLNARQFSWIICTTKAI